MVFYPGRKLCGEIVIADIGFPAYTKYEGHTYFAYDPEDQNQIPKRRADATRNVWKNPDRSRFEGMCGAAYLSALAAYRMGAGLVKILTVRANVPILQNLLPEAILTPYDPEQAQTDPAGFKSLVEQECGWASAIVLGPGLGNGPYVEYLVEDILTSAFVPVIIDADGLNAIAGHPYLTSYYTENIIVTPHLGEMARLTGEGIDQIKENLAATALEYAGLTGKEIVWDLYCGIGTISLFLAQKAKQVYGVEIVPAAIADAKKNAERNGIANAEFYVGKAEDVLPKKYEEEGVSADVIVVDPPRKGCDEALLETMLKMNPERIVYVSCDSATLART